MFSERPGSALIALEACVGQKRRAPNEAGGARAALKQCEFGASQWPVDARVIYQQPAVLC